MDKLNKKSLAKQLENGEHMKEFILKLIQLRLGYMEYSSSFDTIEKIIAKYPVEHLDDYHERLLLLKEELSSFTAFDLVDKIGKSIRKDEIEDWIDSQRNN